jgi:tRNA-Thr(GGU) m(6)t(6)A37 methyltransferase TsaA
LANAGDTIIQSPYVDADDVVRWTPVTSLAAFRYSFSGVVASSSRVRRTPSARNVDEQGTPVNISLEVIGHVRSTVRSLASAPRQGSEGAPDAWLDIDPAFAPALHGIAVGDALVIVTWLHLADREVLEVHPRGDPEVPLAGVFATRSPHRPNPLGLHRVTVREVSGLRLRIGPIEVLDGTPVVDVKPVLVDSADA